MGIVSADIVVVPLTRDMPVDAWTVLDKIVTYRTVLGYRVRIKKKPFLRVIASAMQKLVARSNALCTGYCGESGALSPLSAFSFPFLVPEGAVGRDGVIVTPAAVSLVSRCHNRTVQTIYRPPFIMAVLSR